MSSPELALLELGQAREPDPVAAVVLDGRDLSFEVGVERRDRGGEPASPVEAFLVSLIGAAVPLALAFLLVLGFVGGRVPVLGWTLAGGLGAGLVWAGLVVSAPAALLVVAVIALAGWRRVPGRRPGLAGRRARSEVATRIG